MDRSEIGYILSELRANAPLSGKLGKYAIISIESGRTSYPVANMIIYCKDYSIKIEIVDRIRSERHEIREVDDVHRLIRFMIKDRKINMASLNRAINRNYTSKDKTGSGIPISINMLLIILDYFKCDLKFTKME